jgi:hypothetical protein
MGDMEQGIVAMIRFRCDCGKSMKAEPKYAGLSVSRPRCGKPNLSQASRPEADDRRWHATHPWYAYTPCSHHTT